jgi:hypothetical protein
MAEQLEQWYCIQFCQKLGDSQVETIRKIKRVFGDNGMGNTQIKGWYNRFKMAARLWRAMLILVGPQQTEMMSSLTKYGLWSCRIVVSQSENLRRRGDKHWFGTFHFDR